MISIRSAAFLAAIALGPASAAAQGTAEQRAACTGDAFQFCDGDIPDAKKVEMCLRKKIREISPACREQFRPTSARARPRATPVADTFGHSHQIY